MQYDIQLGIERLRVCISDYMKKKLWANKRWDGLTNNAASIIIAQMEKVRMVIASEWDPCSLTFYVQCPNDIHRHSSVHGEKVRKLASEKLEQLDSENKRKNEAVADSDTQSTVASSGKRSKRGITAARGVARN